MLTAILAFFQAVPAIAGGINNFTTRYYDAKVQITTARIGGDKEVAKQIVSGVVTEGQTRVEYLKAVGGSKILAFLVGGFACPFMIYTWKVVVFDIVLGLGTTDAIKGNVADWGGTIIACLFGSSTVIAAGQMFFNRKQQ